MARDHRGERLLHVDITAMIDVVFLLIIFFMTTAQFARVTKASLDLPKERGEDATRREAGLIVNVTSGGEIIVGGTSVPVSRFGERLAEEIARGGGAAEFEIVVRADRAAPASYINTIAEDLAQIGVRSWRLATAPTSAPTPAPTAAPARGGGGGGGS